MLRMLAGIGGVVMLGCAGVPGLQPPASSLPDGGSLGLNTDTYAAVTVYADLEAEDTDVCRLLPEAAALVEVLQMPLVDHRDAVFDDPAAMAAFEEAIAALDRELDGLQLAVGASTMYVSLDLGTLAHRNLDGAATLRAAGDLLGTSYPSWIRQTWDLGGCADPAAAAAPLAALVDAWVDAPGCIKEVLRPRLAAAIRDLGEARCFCNNRRSVEEGLAALKPSLSKLTRLGGPEAGMSLKTGLDEAIFDDTCSG